MDKFEEARILTQRVLEILSTGSGESNTQVVQNCNWCEKYCDNKSSFSDPCDCTCHFYNKELCRKNTALELAWKLLVNAKDTKNRVVCNNYISEALGCIKAANSEDGPGPTGR